MQGRSKVDISSLNHELYQINPELKAKRLEEIQQLVNEQGLDAFYDRLEEFGIGTDFYLHADELNRIFSIVEEKIEFSDQHSEARKSLSLEHPDVKEADGSAMRYLPNAPFQSWEETINNRPALTFIPRSKQGLENLVKWSKEGNLRIRAAGYRHTSSDAYSENGGILAAMVGIRTATHLPSEHPPMDPDNDLQGITLVGEPYECEGKHKIQCKMGASTIFAISVQ